MKLYPRALLFVRDPGARDHLPADGREVTLTSYWHRRLLDGDVTDTPPATMPAEDPPPPPPPRTRRGRAAKKD